VFSVASYVCPGFICGGFSWRVRALSPEG